MNFKTSKKTSNYFSTICPNDYWNQYYLEKDNKNEKW